MSSAYKKSKTLVNIDKKEREKMVQELIDNVTLEVTKKTLQERNYVFAERMILANYDDNEIIRLARISHEELIQIKASLKIKE
jgi:hypothetical protein